MKITFYLITIDLVEDGVIFSELSDQEIIKIAEHQNSIDDVYVHILTMEGFEKSFNLEDVSSSNQYLRIIKSND